MKDLKTSIREVYYDWANMPGFDLIEKYPNDKRVEDSFIRLFLSFAEECLPERKSFGIILTNEGKEAMSPKEWEMKGFNVCLDKMRENIEKKGKK